MDAGSLPNFSTDPAEALTKALSNVPNEGLHLTIPPGRWTFTKPVPVPIDRRVWIDGKGATLQTSSSVSACFDLTRMGNDIPQPNPFRLCKITDLSFDVGFNAIRSTGVSPHCDELAIERCQFRVFDGYAIDLQNMEYCIAPRFADLRIGPNSGIRFTGTVHNNSCITIERVRIHTFNNKCGPSIYLNGSRMFAIRDVILEGHWGVTGAANHNGPGQRFTHGLLIENPGPRGGIIENLWCEYWGTPDRCRSQLTIYYDYGNGGSNKPGTYILRNIPLAATRFACIGSDGSPNPPDAMMINVESPYMLPDWIDWGAAGSGIWMDGKIYLNVNGALDIDQVGIGVGEGGHRWVNIPTDSRVSLNGIAAHRAYERRRYGSN